jgi:hypothetical protein
MSSEDRVVFEGGAAAAASAESDGVAFQPRLGDEEAIERPLFDDSMYAAHCFDPSRTWSKHPRYFANIDLDKLKFMYNVVPKKEGGGVEAVGERVVNAKDPNAYTLTVITPYMELLWPKLFPFGFCKPWYPAKEAADKPEKAKYSALLSAHAWDPELDDGNHQYKPALAFLRFIKEIYDRWRAHVKETPPLYQALLEKRIDLKKRAIIDKKKELREKKRSGQKLEAAEEELLRAKPEDLVTEEKIRQELEYADGRDPVKSFSDKETLDVKPFTEHAQVAGRVFRKMSAKYRALLDKRNTTFSSETACHLYHLRTEDCPNGMSHNEIEVVTMHDGKVVPQNKCRTVVNHGAVVAMEVQIKQYTCDGMFGRCGISLQPTKLFLYRRGREGLNGSTAADDAAMVMGASSGAEEIILPDGDDVDAPLVHSDSAAPAAAAAAAAAASAPAPAVPAPAAVAPLGGLAVAPAQSSSARAEAEADADAAEQQQQQPKPKKHRKD